MANVIYPSMPRGYNWLAIGDTFNQSFDRARDQRYEREAGPLLEQAFGQYLGPQQQPGMSLSSLSQAQPGGVERAPLPAQQDYASSRVAQAHGDPMASLIQNESGGNYRAQNNAMGAGGQRGHYGRLQFGNARLADAKRAGVIPQGMTPEQFMSSPETQQAVERWHFADIDRQAQEKGLMNYVGQEVGGVTITPDAIRSMAHLGGINGAERFIKSGGRYNPADANGTRLSDYGQRHGGQASPQAALEGLGEGQSVQMPGMPQAGMQTASMGMPDADTMRQLFANPVTRPYAIQLAQANIAAQQDANDPMRQLQLEQARLQIEQMRNPQAETTSGIREYEYARQQGFQGSFADFQQQQKRAGATNINMPGQPNIGSIPQGYAAQQDPETGSWSMAPIPGGPADDAASNEAKSEQAQTWNTIVNQEIGRALEIIDTSMLPTTGAVGDLLSGVGGTASRDLRGLLDTIRSNAGFDRLQQMREASPTGGALGAVSERELAFLQATIGNLEQSQSREQLEFNLRRLQTIYENMLSGKRAYDGLIDGDRGNRAITDMSDEELEAIINGQR